jgi:hypothetical protein
MVVGDRIAATRAGVRFMICRRRLLFGLAPLLCLGATGAWADRASHDEARRALERGEVRPLAEILQMVQAELGGEVVSVDLERKNGDWLYEFRVIAPDGRRREIYVDALSGAVRRVKAKGQ